MFEGHTFMRLRYCNDFIPFTFNTLFNLALWFKLYFSFRESYDLILI